MCPLRLQLGAGRAARAIRGRRQAERVQPASAAQRDQGRDIPVAAGGLQERHPAGHQGSRRHVLPLVPAPGGVPARARPPEEEAPREEARLSHVPEGGPVPGRVPRRHRARNDRRRRGPRRWPRRHPPEDRPDPDARAADAKNMVANRDGAIELLEASIARSRESIAAPEKLRRFNLAVVATLESLLEAHLRELDQSPRRS